MVMMVRKFINEYHEEYGERGWRPEWLKHLGFDPSWNFGVSHDIMEHQVDRIGGAEGEFMAFGAMLLVRGEGGYFSSNGRNIEHDMPYNFPDIFRRINDGHQTLKDPGRTYLLGNGYEYWNESINGIVNKGIQLSRNEWDDLDNFPISFEEAKRRIIGWMRKGFRKAYVFYCKRHDMHPEELTYIFNQITEQVEKKSLRAEPNDMLVIRINLEQCRVSSELISRY